MTPNVPETRHTSTRRGIDARAGRVSERARATAGCVDVTRARSETGSARERREGDDGDDAREEGG